MKIPIGAPIFIAVIFLLNATAHPQVVLQDLLTTPLSIRTSSASQICMSKSRQRTLMSPVRMG